MVLLKIGSVLLCSRFLKDAPKPGGKGDGKVHLQRWAILLGRDLTLIC